MTETVAQLKVNVSAAITVNEGAIRALKTVKIVADAAKDVSEVKKYIDEAIVMMEKEAAQQPAVPPPTATQTPAPASEPAPEPPPPPRATHHNVEPKHEATSKPAAENKKK